MNDNIKQKKNCPKRTYFGFVRPIHAVSNVFIPSSACSVKAPSLVMIKAPPDTAFCVALLCPWRPSNSSTLDPSASMILSSAFEKRSISCMILHDVGEAETGADAEAEAAEAEAAEAEATVAEAIGGRGMGGAVAI